MIKCARCYGKLAYRTWVFNGKNNPRLISDHWCQNIPLNQLLLRPGEMCSNCTMFFEISKPSHLKVATPKLIVDDLQLVGRYPMVCCSTYPVCSLYPTRPRTYSDEDLLLCESEWMNEWMLWCLMSLFGKFVTPRQVPGHFKRKYKSEPKLRTCGTSLEDMFTRQPIGRLRASRCF